MTKFVQSKDVAWNFLGDSIVAFNLSGEKEFHNLNPTAAMIFSNLDTPRTSDELTAALQEEFDVDFATATTDVIRTLNEMHAKRLITEL